MCAGRVGHRITINEPSTRSAVTPAPRAHLQSHTSCTHVLRPNMYPRPRAYVLCELRGHSSIVGPQKFSVIPQDYTLRIGWALARISRFTHGHIYWYYVYFIYKAQLPCGQLIGSS